MYIVLTYTLKSSGKNTSYYNKCQMPKVASLTLLRQIDSRGNVFSWQSEYRKLISDHQIYCNQTWGLGSSKTLYFAHMINLKPSNERFQKLLTAKDEIIHTRLSIYIRYSSLTLDRGEKSHSLMKRCIFTQSFGSPMERNSVFHKRTFST